MEFSSTAQWIWTDGQESQRNDWILLRRCFDCPSTAQSATILVTADSRYELSVNGVAVGRGPVRSYPWAYSYDEYDLLPYLHRGQMNVVAARVVHWGAMTMQYFPGRGGFLCDIVISDAHGQPTVITGAAGWQTHPDSAVTRQTPPICIQMPFEEQYDARQELAGWDTGDDTSAFWVAAQAIGPVGCAPWTSLTPRTIPYLTADAVAPTRVLAVELACPRQGTWWSLDATPLAGTLEPMHNAAPLGERLHALVTELVVDHPCTVRLWATYSYEPGTIWLRGTQIGVSDGPIPSGPLDVQICLQAGPNLLVVANAQRPILHIEHTGQVHCTAQRLVTSEQDSAVWAYLGPIDERTDLLPSICASTTVDDLPTSVRRVPVPASAALTDIFGIVASQDYRAIAGGFCAPTISRPNPRPFHPAPRPQPVLHADALLHDSSDWTIIQPQPDGDVHMVIDFGRELVGYLEIEIDAPEGTVIDLCGFEGIDNTGIFWTWGLHNTLRYTCRAGRQHFRSHLRRGFRYVSLTIRQHASSVRIRHIDCLLSTYPVEERGQFLCSDQRLTTIWTVAADTVRLCMEDTYVDCPAYEQVFWVGDARNSALVNAVTFGAYDLTDRCLRLVGQSLAPQIAAIKPPHLRARAHLTVDHVVSSWFSEIPMWTFLWVWNVWEHYWITGDTAALADHYRAVRTCLSIAEGFLSDRDLFAIPDVWNLVDWAAMDLTRHGEVTANTALFAAALRRAAEMAEVLGDTDQATADRALATRLAVAINQYCWNEQRAAYVDTVRDAHAYHLYVDQVVAHGFASEPMLRSVAQPDTRERFFARERISEPTNTVVMLCACVPPERSAQVAALVRAARNGAYESSNPWMAEHWPSDQIVPVGSPWFLFFTLETLIAMGEPATAVQIMREQWGRMIDLGATTFWETFPGHVAEGHWSRSLCHGWSAAPAYFLTTQVLGVRPLSAGYGHVAIAPLATQDITWATGVVPTPRGDITVSWQHDPARDTWQVNLTLPATVTAELHLPATAEGHRPALTTGSGTLERTAAGWRIHLPAGSQAGVAIM